MTYPGGKGGSGTYQQIINQMPPHDIYIEPFLGGGAVMRHKRPAPLSNIGIDADAAVIDRLSQEGRGRNFFYQADALTWLQQNRMYTHCEDTLIYCDPPYLFDVRSSSSPIYAQEMGGWPEHERLLDLLLTLPCMVMISGYYSDLYARKLATWRTHTFTSQTRGGPRTEWLWMNYPEPAELHDYRYLGSDYRQRENLARKKKRWLNKLRSMPALERYALMNAIEDYKRQ